MLKLAAQQREPFWLDIVPGVRVRVRPITSAAIIAARHAAAEAMKDAAEAERVSLASAAFTRNVALWGIVDWDGVGDADGNPIKPSPETIDGLLEVWPAFDALDRLYVAPALVLDAEKNGSSPLPNGTSAGAKATARRARKNAKPALTENTGP
jgi:hypothetical protein